MVEKMLTSFYVAVLNLWRILRVQVHFYFLRKTNQFLTFLKNFKIAIQSYTFEKLTLWWKSNVPECKSEEASHPAAPQRHP